MVQNKKYTVHTRSQVISFHSNQQPEYTDDDRIIFVKPSGNDIIFERRNVICVDEITVSDNSGQVSTD